MEALMTSEEVCEVLKISQATLRRREKAGLIVPVRISSSAKRYDPKDIREYIDSLKEDEDACA